MQIPNEVKVIEIGPRDGLNTNKMLETSRTLSRFFNKELDSKIWSLNKIG